MIAPEHCPFVETLAANATGEAGITQRVLDANFWQLTYWKTPYWYDALTSGERMHPGILPALREELAGKIVADIGAGSGRLTLACLAQRTARIHAIDPCPALLRVLAHKACGGTAQTPLTLQRGSFEALPLPDDSIDTIVSCAAFTVEEHQKAQDRLREMHRILKPGGRIIFIWPRPQDLAWLQSQGFQHHAPPPRRAQLRPMPPVLRPECWFRRSAAA